MNPFLNIKTVCLIGLFLLVCANVVQAQKISKVEAAVPSTINSTTAAATHTFKITISEELGVPGEADLALQLENGPTVGFGQTIPVTSGTSPITFSGKFRTFPDHFQGNGRFVVTYRRTSTGQGLAIESAPIPIHIDLLPPRIVSVRPIEDNFGARALVMTVAEENPTSGYAAELFTVKSVPDAENLLESPAGGQFSVVNGEIMILLKKTVNTLIRVEVKDGKKSDQSAVSFQDRLGNVMGPFETTVSVTGQRPSGPAVEYPPFVVPADAGRHSDNNKVRPSGRVVTRVVKLYYYRDADRVAEIINRRAQQYNLANVRAKESRAQIAGDKAEDATAKRRAAQIDAENAARRTREAEQELAALATNAEEAQSVMQQLTGVPKDLFVVSDGSGRLALVSEANLAPGTDNTKLTKVSDFESQLQQVVTDFNQRRADVADLRLKEQELNDLARSLDNQESRLIRAQFLRELDAAQEDPNTYAKGDIDSFDPVMQTSVSVIGEGTIQLRGPIEGINQIRRMIHQIDTPVGQVKIDLQTIQINGEKGEQLEETVQLVEGYINAGRFLTNQSLVFLSRSVSEVAAEVAQENGQPWERDQMGRDMRYLYGFFGQDFVDTLYRMDSEFLHTENQILSLHSMDSISRNRALFLIGLAKNSVRQRILERFQQYILNDLATMEFEYRMINKSIPCQYLPDCREECKQKMRSVFRKHQCECPLYTPEMAVTNAADFYKFLNFQNFFAQGDWQDATLNPMQREFIRLAQIYKSQLIAEIELKQRIVERGLMDQRLSEDAVLEQNQLTKLRTEAITSRTELLSRKRAASEQLGETYTNLLASISKAQVAQADIVSRRETQSKYNSLIESYSSAVDAESTDTPVDESQRSVDRNRFRTELLERINQLLAAEEMLAGFVIRSDTTLRLLAEFDRVKLEETIANLTNSDAQMVNYGISTAGVRILDGYEKLQAVSEQSLRESEAIKNAYREVAVASGKQAADYEQILMTLQQITDLIPQGADSWRKQHESTVDTIVHLLTAGIAIDANQQFLAENRQPLQHLKLLDHLIDEHEEKSMDLLEGTRAHISSIDNFLKRMTFALEDDFQVQFYDPNLVCIRTAARGHQVALSQVERTTVLGNNRELLKVLPQATMEFDLPKRQIRVAEAMQGAKALVDDYGALLKDPTFLAAYQLSGGGVPAESVRKMLPSGLSETAPQQFHALSATQNPESLGSNLQSLVPDPEIYQFETGTGFEVRPVIQPDGDSLVYDLTYLYTTELREPVRADEKHLGRVKRHFIHTQVQTSSFELREVGRYQVALKAARTSRGVPMLENAPVVGGLFRPAPSEESSIQQNIILGRSVVYPTLYDLMGLAWAQHVAELGYDDIRNAGHVARGRQQMVRQHVFDESSRNVDNFLQITPEDEHYRPDLYREHSLPSPYHPNGYVYPDLNDDADPTRRGFRTPDRRPEAFRSMGSDGIPAEPFDDRFRSPLQPRTQLP